jgi:hypothetical protein
MRLKALGADVVDSAVSYATRLGWPVFPGTSITGDGQCSCGRPDCLRPGAHPQHSLGWRAASCDVVTVMQSWQRSPGSCIVSPAGMQFDVLDFPEGTGLEGLRRLDARGNVAGPILKVSGRVLVFVRVGVADLFRLRIGDRVKLYDVRLLTDGDIVVLPPCADMAWVSEDGPWRLSLPDARSVIPVLASAYARNTTAGRTRTESFPRRGQR